MDTPANSNDRQLRPAEKELFEQCNVPEEGKMTLTYHYEKTTPTESEVVDITLTKESVGLKNQCPQCGRGFFTELALSHHMRIHKGRTKPGMWAGAATGIAVGAGLGPMGAAAGALIGGAVGLASELLPN